MSESEQTTQTISSIRLKDGKTYDIKDKNAASLNDVVSKINLLKGDFKSFETVQELPEIKDADPHIIYLINSNKDILNDSSKKNQYEEFVVIDSAWEKLGYTDLSDYTKTNDLINKIIEDNNIKQIEEALTRKIDNNNSHVVIDDNSTVVFKQDNKFVKTTVSNLINLFTNKDYYQGNNLNYPITANVIYNSIKTVDVTLTYKEVKQLTDEITEIIKAGFYKLTINKDGFNIDFSSVQVLGLTIIELNLPELFIQPMFEINKENKIENLAVNIYALEDISLKNKFDDNGIVAKFRINYISEPKEKEVEVSESV